MFSGLPTPYLDPPVNRHEQERLLRSFLRAARFAGLVVLLIGCLVLSGWAFGAMALISVLPGLPPMVPNTALALSMAGLALWLHQARLPARLSARLSARLTRIITPLAHALSVGVLLVGGLTLGAYLGGYELPIDRTLLPPEWRDGSLAGRPPLTTAVNLTLLGAALLLIFLPWEGVVAVGQVLALTAAINGARALIGYGASPGEIYVISNRTGIAVQSAIAYIVLGIGVLCARPRNGMMGLVSSTGQGGRVYRLLAPPAVIVPLLIGALTIWGQEARLFGVGVGTAAQAFVNLLAFWWLARALNRSEALAERETERAVEALVVAERRMGRLQGLRDIDRAINSQPQHVGAILDVLLEAVRGQLDVDYAAVLLLHEGRNELMYTRGLGLLARVG